MKTPNPLQTKGFGIFNFFLFSPNFHITRKKKYHKLGSNILAKFILNNTVIKTGLPQGMALLDFIRYEQQLFGTKIGCREGDCGACTVLVGEIKDNGQLNYRSAVSCLMPLGNVHGKHIVTVEGINLPQLNPIQEALVACGGSQCGFCTPGFVVSLAGFCLSNKPATPQNAIASIDGNICRCTGYKSIERAATQIADLLAQKRADFCCKNNYSDGSSDAGQGLETSIFAAQEGFLPPYFADIKVKLGALREEIAAEGTLDRGQGIGQKKREANIEKEQGFGVENVPFKSYHIGGGTDLYVQKHEQVHQADLELLFDRPALNGIFLGANGQQCYIGGAATVADIAESEVLNRFFKRLPDFVKLVSSTPIRNMATLAGNFVNASPIGDFTVFFLALNAQIVLRKSDNSTRQLPLRQFYKGYKLLAKEADEIIETIFFDLPAPQTDAFSFEKVSKRTHLDIASVNSALYIRTEANNPTLIAEAGLSAGGVAPIPAFLADTSTFLQGKFIGIDTVREAIERAQAEVRPISDVRGSSTYKRLLLGQLIKAHFLTLFPKSFSATQLLALDF